MYKKSYYNFSKSNEKNTVLYNSMTGAIAYIPNIELHRLNFNSSNKNQLLFDDVLFKNGFIIESSTDEKELLKKRYEYARNNNVITQITLLPTENCNFACPYCFLYDTTPKRMESIDYEKIYMFIQNKITSGSKNIIINWFGGEPSLEAENIVKFMKNLNQNIGKEITISSTITTNGYLLNYNLFKQFLNSGIDTFQVTVDGNKESHDEQRYLKSGKGTYDTILKNIIEIINNVSDSDKFMFNVRSNFTQKTIKVSDEQIDNLKKIFGSDDRFNLYFRPVYEYETNHNSLENFNHELYSIEDGILLQNKLYQKINKAFDRVDSSTTMRMLQPLPQPTFTWCNSDKKDTYIISPNGDLYMCDTLFGDDKFIIGNINDKFLADYNSEYNNWNKSIFDDYKAIKCMECKLLPVCFGSCRRNRFISGEDFNCYWTEEYIYKILDEILYSNKI
ncbi:radical SAM/SPASM domain-containing protein [Tissierella sp.]|uniref:radical SAM/SPASM domain-containing protein n=1 Tax=Tissierella sp. TaxID=41274 RepID=UPI00285A7561|nr:radical SAM protein [Tissierella sp.]MDR7855081.1 SPASM domain-containing protein [Tissierella sp.]